MPQKILPDADAFAWFERELTARGFRPISDAEFVGNFKRLRLKAPRPRPGREAGFTFTANGLTVWVWTTWLRKESEARPTDLGWAAITKDDVPLYFSRPITRTGNFFLKLFRRAWITQWKVAHRPHCPACGEFMEIVHGPELKDRYWQCNRTAQHKGGDARAYRWDIGLPPKARKLNEMSRASYNRFKAKQIAAGKKPHAAMLTRKPWRPGEAK